MNTKQLEYVIVLEQTGSFSKAADELGISQPSLSQYIKKIEKEIGLDLFDRSGGSLRLTDAGRVYIDSGRKILDIEHQMNGRFLDISSDKIGTISIGLSAHRSVALMPEIVSDFRKKYPGIILKLDERPRREILDAAEHGEFDICISTLPVNESIFDYELIMNEENVIAVARDSHIGDNAKKLSQRKFPAINITDISECNFAMLNKEHPMQRKLESLAEEYALKLNKTVECTSLEALVEMVKVGMGAALIPSCLAKDCEKLKFFSIAEETKPREIILIHRKKQFLSKSVRDLCSLLTTYFK